MTLSDPVLLQDEPELYNGEIVLKIAGNYLCIENGKIGLGPHIDSAVRVNICQQFIGHRKVSRVDGTNRFLDKKLYANFFDIPDNMKIYTLLEYHNEILKFGIGIEAVDDNYRASLQTFVNSLTFKEGLKTLDYVCVPVKNI